MVRFNQTVLRNNLKVYFIMGSNNCVIKPVDVLTEAIEGGVTFFQFREKGTGALSGEDKRRLAIELQSICKQNSIPFIVNDDVELALSIDADGVHIGQEDETIENVRQRFGDKILGVSVHSEEEAEAAISAGADYLGIGPIFSTTTKEDAKPAAGVSLIQLLREKDILIPIVGIGGITSTNASSVMDAGADGVAVITAISHADSPRGQTKELVQAVGNLN